MMLPFAETGSRAEVPDWGRVLTRMPTFNKGPKMQIGLVVYEQVGIGCKAHREALDQKLSGTHLWPRSVSATLLPPFPDCVWVLSSENRFYYFLFVCFPLADISHVQCPALGSASGMLE